MHNPDRQISRITGSEETRREKSPGWRLGKKPGGPGSQKNGHPGKMTVREAKKAVIQAGWPPGKPKTRPSKKDGRPGSKNGRREGKNGAGKAQKVAGRPPLARGRPEKMEAASSAPEIRSGGGGVL